jgi:small basic protein
MKKLILGIIIGIIIGAMYSTNIKRMYNTYAPKKQITALLNKIKPE